MKGPDGKRTTPKSSEAYRFGGHLVLDFLNSVALTKDGPVDQLGDPNSVCRWLTESGLTLPSNLNRSQLSEMAADLREVVRELVQHRLSKRAANPARLNKYLEGGEAHWTIVWGRASGPARSLVRTGEALFQVLAPLAEAAAELLASDDFWRVKRCGNPDCTMLFFDPSATGRRRWCDMTTCGNRMKVASFRERQRGDS